MFEQFQKYWHFNMELNEIYANMFLRSFGLSMVGLFVPIYFLQKGMTLDAVLLQYFAVMSLVSIVANIVAVRLMSTIGLKHTVVASIPFLIAQLILLQLSTTTPIHPSLIGALGGISLAFYWMALHTDFALSTDKKKEGSESGMMFIAVRMASVVGPILGGVILTQYGFSMLFLMALVVIFLSALPLLRTADVKRVEVLSWTSYMTVDNARYSIRFFVEGVRSIVEGILWPVFIYTVLTDFIEVGAAGSLALLGAAVFSGVIGKASDRWGTRKLLGLLSMPLAILYYGMPLATNSFIILLISLGIGIMSVGIDLPIYRSFIRHSKENDIVGYTLFRENLIHVGKLIGILTVVLSVEKFATSFYLTSFLTLLMLL